MKQSYADKLVAMKSLALNLSFTKPEFLIEHNRFIPVILFLAVFYYMLFDSIEINIHIGIGNDFIKIKHSISNRFIIFMANV